MEGWYLVNLKNNHEGNIWREPRAVISFIIKKQILLHFYCHGDRCYNRYIERKKRQNNNLDNDDTGVKPEHFLQILMRYTPGYDPIQQIWDRYRKIARDFLEEKENQMDIFIFMGQNSVRLEAIWQWGHVSFFSFSFGPASNAPK